MNSNNLCSVNVHLIGIIYSDVKREYFPSEFAYLTEKDAYKDAQIIRTYIEKISACKLYPGDAELPNELKKDKLDMVMNLVDSVERK